MKRLPLPRRRELDAAVRAEHEGHQGADRVAEGDTCMLPRPRQQRHCRDYLVDTGARGEQAGQCLHRVGATCNLVVSERGPR